MSDKGDFVAGVIVGSLIGLVAGVLFAPGPGEETRLAVRDRAADTYDRVRDSTDRMRDGVNQVTGSIRERFAGSVDPPAVDTPDTPVT